MNPGTNKEIRTLLPAFAVTILAPLITLPFLMFWSRDAVMTLCLFLAASCSLGMGALAFGDEFSNRTMGLLLSQPIPRLNIWRRKMTVLGVAVASSFVIITFAAYLYVGEELSNSPAERFSFMVVLTCFAVGIFCTTPFWTLCIKNVIGAVAASFLVPMALALFINVLVNYYPVLERHGDFLEKLMGDRGYLMVLTLAIYFGLCYWLGRKSFLKLEVIESAGTEIKLPDGLERVLVRPLRMLLPGQGGPTRSLVSKELRLQQACFLMAAIYCPVFFLGAAGWRISTSETALNLATTIMICGCVVYVFLTAFITGGVCVAEERNWGMLGYQLALPPSKLRQWIIKVSVALTTSLVLGVFLPLIVYYVCRWLFHLPVEPVPNSDGPLNPTLLLLYLLLTGTAVYASSLTTSTLRAVLMAFVLIILAGTGISLGVIAGMRYAEATSIMRRQIFRQGQVLGGFFSLDAADLRLALGLGFGFLLVLLLYLGFTNFRAVQPSTRRQWGQPALILLAITVISFVLAFVTYG